MGDALVPKRQPPMLPPKGGRREAGPEVWHCGCGAQTTLDFERDKNVVPIGWVTMKLWIGGAGEYGGTKMDEKILCQHCAHKHGVAPAPTQQAPIGPMKLLLPKRK
jgi:hypothetical protein